MIFMGEICAGGWHVVMAVRDFSKAELVAKRNGFPKDSYSVMHCDLASLTSVRQFVENFRYALDSTWDASLLQHVCRKSHADRCDLSANLSITSLLRGAWRAPMATCPQP